MHHLALCCRRARCAVLVLAAAITVANVGCIDTTVPDALTPLQLCEREATVDCRGYWTCWTSEERDAQRSALLAAGIDIGSSQRLCDKNLKALCTTQPFKCEKGLTFQEMKAGVCADSLQRLSCEEWSSDGFVPLGCDKVCSATIIGG